VLGYRHLRYAIDWTIRVWVVRAGLAVVPLEV
jgi:hypothetical protein